LNETSIDIDNPPDDVASQSVVSQDMSQVKMSSYTGSISIDNLVMSANQKTETILMQILENLSKNIDLQDRIKQELNKRNVEGQSAMTTLQPDMSTSFINQIPIIKSR